MIFLYRDHSYDIINGTDKKISKKFHHRYDDIEYVLVDANSRLRSDCFIMVKRDHFLTDVVDFQILYELAFIDLDEPVTDHNSLHRCIEVTNLYELYGVASLLLQLDNATIAGNVMSLGALRPIITYLSIQFDGKEIKWNPKKMGLNAFLNENGIYCDTDDVLKRGYCDEGNLPFYTLENENGELSYHMIPGLIHLGKRWCIKSPSHRGREDFITSDSIVGFLIEGTGLVYLAHHDFAMQYYSIAQCSFTVEFGRYRTYFDPDCNAEVQMIEDSGSNLDFTSYSSAGMLEMCLYIPQIIDIYRYFGGETPIRVVSYLIQDKIYEKSLTMQLGPIEKDEAIHMDLFALLASTMTHQPNCICINEN